tara:strand:+ start:4139 stop:4360 length:222 start_codon:yes stop_codon:yes gene_type:complete
MGEARRRKDLGLSPRQEKPNKTNFFSQNFNSREKIISLLVKGGWLGIAILIAIWITVRFIGPAAGWWIPADNL